MNRIHKLINLITDVIAYCFYPCRIKLNITNGINERCNYITKYLYGKHTYQNEIFKVYISDDNFNYEILKHIEGETILNNKFFCK